MSHSNLKKQIMSKICEKSIKPKPRINFIVKESLVWILSLLSLIIGSFATSSIIFLIQNSDWDIYENLNDNIVEFTILTLPYFWIILLIAIITIINTNLKNTNKCYKYNPTTLLFIIIVLSTVLGSILFYQGAGYHIDSILNESSPRIHKLINYNAKAWSRPYNGFLAGEIYHTGTSTNFKIIDLNKHTWLIITHSKLASSSPKLTIGQRVRLIGEPSNQNTFIATKIMPTKFKGCPLSKNTLHNKNMRLCPIHQPSQNER